MLVLLSLLAIVEAGPPEATPTFPDFEITLPPPPPKPPPSPEEERRLLRESERERAEDIAHNREGTALRLSEEETVSGVVIQNSLECLQNPDDYDEIRTHKFRQCIHRVGYRGECDEAGCGNVTHPAAAFRAAEANGVLDATIVKFADSLEAAEQMKAVQEAPAKAAVDARVAAQARAAAAKEAKEARAAKAATAERDRDAQATTLFCVLAFVLVSGSLMWLGPKATTHRE